MEVLTESQLRFYRDNGYLMLESQIPKVEIDRCIVEIEKFRAEASHLNASNDRLDLEDTHTPDNPRVRRIKLPHTISDVFADLMRSDHVLAPVRDLIGKDLRLHTSKLNMKSAGYGAAVEWHQDWAFYPHTNDDLAAVGIMIDDFKTDNGSMLVLPRSHTGPIYNHHAKGYFVGGIDPVESGIDFSKSVMCTGKAGSITVHHVRLLHGSSANTSGSPRRFLLHQYRAADAWPLIQPPTSWDAWTSMLVSGVDTLEPRMTAVPVRLPYPAAPMQGSIYENQRDLETRFFKDLDVPAATAPS